MTQSPYFTGTSGLLLHRFYIFDMTLPVTGKRSVHQNKQMGFANISSEFHDYWKESGRKVHGGSHALNLRKTKRPFDSKKPLHLVLKSERAQGTLSMWKPANKTFIQKIITKHAALCDVRIYRFSNNGNHLHLAVRAKEKRQFQKFLRSISGLIARYVLNAKKGRPAVLKPVVLAKNLPQKTGASKPRKFWTALAFTRVTEWGQAFTKLSNYVIQNILEAAGVIPYQPRKHTRKVLADKS